MADSAELIAHVKDAEFIHLPFGYEVHIPQVFERVGIPFHLTKFMVMELVVALVMVAIFVPLGRKIASGRRPRGRLWNMFEVILLFLRDEVARPAIGRHDADRFMPLLWNAFFFILFCNLAGLLPWIGTPTGELGATGALAIIAFTTVLGAGMLKYGVLGYWKGQVPHMDLPLAVAIFLKPLIFFIEVMGLCVKHGVLAIRLFANMFGGHLVLAVILGFIVQSAHGWVWYGVMPASVFGAVALSLLELMVAFIQAYVFTFLFALFIGMAVHQH